MSFPPSLTTRTVKGRFVTYPDGTPAKGSVRIVLAKVMQGPADDTFVVPFDEMFPLDEGGSFSVVLPATDDPQWTPSFYKVTVTTEIQAQTLRTKGLSNVLSFKLDVPYDSTAPIDLTDVVNIPARTASESYVLLASKGVPGGIASLGSDGKVPTSQLPAANAGVASWLDLTDVPTAFPPSAHSHVVSDVTGLTTSLASKVSASDLTAGLAGKADSNHVHATSQVTGLDAALSGKASTTHTHSQTDVTGLGTALSAKADAATVTTALGLKADASTVTTALSSKADLVAGVLPTSQLPAIAVVDFLGSVSTQAAMLALIGQKGDWCIRTDLGQTWIITGNAPTQLTSWTAMPIGTSPVQTVNGQTGAVVLAKADIGLGNVDNTSDAGKPVSTAQQTALNLKAPLASPTFTGTVSGVTAAMVGLGNVNNTADSAKPVSTAQQTALDAKAPLVSPTFTGTVTVPTPASTDNSTKPATTAFVRGYTLPAILLSAAAAVPGGTPAGTLVFRTAT